MSSDKLAASGTAEGLALLVELLATDPCVRENKSATERSSSFEGIDKGSGHLMGSLAEPLAASKSGCLDGPLLLLLSFVFYL